MVIRGNPAPLQLSGRLEKESKVWEVSRVNNKRSFINEQTKFVATSHIVQYLGQKSEIKEFQFDKSNYGKFARMAVFSTIFSKMC